MSEDKQICVGQPAPGFKLKDQNGNMVWLRDFANKKWVVLYFYPMDKTPGCTKEACNFRDAMNRFAPFNVQVLGVGVDNANSHLAFANKHNLNFPLLADPTKKTTKAYGVLAFYRRPRRVTFIIDPEGIIRRIFNQVNPSAHVNELLVALRDLQSQ